MQTWQWFPSPLDRREAARADPRRSARTVTGRSVPIARPVTVERLPHHGTVRVTLTLGRRSDHHRVRLPEVMAARVAGRRPDYGVPDRGLPSQVREPSQLAQSAIR